MIWSNCDTSLMLCGQNVLWAKHDVAKIIRNKMKMDQIWCGWPNDTLITWLNKIMLHFKHQNKCCLQGFTKKTNSHVLLFSLSYVFVENSIFCESCWWELHLVLGFKNQHNDFFFQQDNQSAIRSSTLYLIYFHFFPDYFGPQHGWLTIHFDQMT